VKRLKESDLKKRLAKEAYFIDIVAYRVQATLARGQMAPGSVPAGSGRAGSFLVAPRSWSGWLWAAAGLASGLVLSWVLGPGGAVVGGGSFWSLFERASDRRNEPTSESVWLKAQG
jgi:hypothetical protein